MRRRTFDKSSAAFWKRAKHLPAIGALVIAGSLVAGTARADVLLFSFTSGSDVASWEQPSNPTPTDVTSNNIVVDVQNGTETTAFAGTDSFPYVLFQTATNSLTPGGFRTQTDNIITEGPVLFAGSGSDPVFSAGTYDLMYLNENSDVFVPGVLVVTVESTSVPEPSSLLLFIAGLMAIVVLRCWHRNPFETTTA